jgi:GNAT superfamily N-acetyltransferase
VTVDTAVELRRLDRAAVQPFLPQLSAWLLPGAFYGVQHTWPQLYRSDGDGRFLALFAGERLVSHCAYRLVALRTDAGVRRVALLGSVATDPRERGRGHAGRLLRCALADCRDGGAGTALLWAERPELYARQGFGAGGDEECLLLQLPPELAPDAGAAGVRPASIADHDAMWELHRQKPLGVERSRKTMSGLLTTPGMSVFVRERCGQVVAYACCGKGADLQNWWHEVGGGDEDLAALLPAAMARLGQAAAFVLVPPYRPQLADALGHLCTDRARVAGPMQAPLDALPPAPVWIDGLDSV